MVAISVKTIYIGFHDAPTPGETPTYQYEPVPVKMAITHSEATNIVNNLRDKLKAIANPERVLNPGAFM